MRRIFSVILGFSALVGCASDHRPGEMLIARLKQEEVYRQLVAWVDSNISPGKLGKEKLQLEVGTPERPKAYRVNIDFDWGILGRKSPSSIYLNCDENGEWISVWFGSMRSAVIVGIKPPVPVQWDEIVYSDRRIAVYYAKD